MAELLTLIEAPEANIEILQLVNSDMRLVEVVQESIEASITFNEDCFSIQNSYVVFMQCVSIWCSCLDKILSLIQTEIVSEEFLCHGTYFVLFTLEVFMVTFPSYLVNANMRKCK